MEPVNAKTGLTHTELRDFIRNHFEEFVNRKNVQIGTVNFAVLCSTCHRRNIEPEPAFSTMPSWRTSMFYLA
jgi:hypothetical protein